MAERLFCYPDRCNKAKCFKCKEKKNCNSNTVDCRTAEQEPSIHNDENDKTLVMQSDLDSITYNEKEKSLNHVSEKNNNIKEKPKESESSLFKKGAKADKAVMIKSSEDVKTEESKGTQPTKLKSECKNCNEKDEEELASRNIKDISKNIVYHQPSSKSNVKINTSDDSKIAKPTLAEEKDSAHHSGQTSDIEKTAVKSKDREQNESKGFVEKNDQTSADYGYSKSVEVNLSNKETIDMQNDSVLMRSVSVNQDSVTNNEKQKSLNQTSEKNQKGTKEKDQGTKSLFSKKSAKAVITKKSKDTETEKSECTQSTNIKQEQELENSDNFSERNKEKLKSENIKDISNNSLNHQPSSKSNVKTDKSEGAKLAKSTLAKEKQNFSHLGYNTEKLETEKTIVSRKYQEEKELEGSFGKKDKESADHSSSKSADINLASNKKDNEVLVPSTSLNQVGITSNERENSINQDSKKNQMVTKEKQKESKFAFLKKSSKADKAIMVKHSEYIQNEELNAQSNKIKKEQEMENFDLLFNLNNSQKTNSNYCSNNCNKNNDENLKSKNIKDVSKNSLKDQPLDKSYMKSKKSENGKLAKPTLAEKKKSAHESRHNQKTSDLEKIIISNKHQEQKLSKRSSQKKDIESVDHGTKSNDLNLSSKEKGDVSRNYTSFWKIQLKHAKEVSDHDSSSSELDPKKNPKQKTCWPPGRSFQHSISSKKNSCLPGKKACCSSPRCTNRDSEKILNVYSTPTDSESESSSEYSSYDEDDPRIATFIAKFAKIQINLEKLWRYINNGNLWKHVNNSNFRIVYGPSIDESFISLVENIYDYLRHLGLLN